MRSSVTKDYTFLYMIKNITKTHRVHMIKNITETHCVYMIKIITETHRVYMIKIMILLTNLSSILMKRKNHFYLFSYEPRYWTGYS
jgi:hypothetical protein